MRVKTSTVKELYEYFEHNGLPMLTNFDGDFWAVYRANYQYFDRLFMKTYKHFTAFSNDEGSVEDNAVEWSFDIVSFLAANEKRYDELYRLQEISDVDYSILDSYRVSESHEIITESDTTDAMGSRTDTKDNSTVFGSHTDSENNSFTHGARSESDSETMNYDTDITNTTVDLDVGSQTNTTENKVSADNASEYAPKDHRTDISGTRKDSTDTHEERDAREDTKQTTHTEASFTDSESKTYARGTYTNTSLDTNVYGQHTNTHETDETIEKTINKSGNLGVYSYAKLLTEHKELWEAFNFYRMVFEEIADAFLRIVY